MAGIVRINTWLLLFTISFLMGCSPAPPATPVPPETSPAGGSTEKPKPKRFSFRGDTPGVMTLEEFKAKHRSHPSDEFDRNLIDDGKEGDAKYRIDDTERWTVESIPVTSAYYDFQGGKLLSIHLNADQDLDRVLLPALIEKFGPVTRRQVDPKLAFYFWEEGPTSAHLMLTTHFGSLVWFTDSELDQVRKSRPDLRRPDTPIVQPARQGGRAEGPS